MISKDAVMSVETGRKGFRGTIGALLILLWTALCLGYYGARLPLSFVSCFQNSGGVLPDGTLNAVPLASPIAGALVMIFAAWGLGTLLMRRLALEGLSEMERLPLTLLSGLFIMGMATFALGMSGLLYPCLFRILTVAGAAWGLWSFTKERRASGRPNITETAGGILFVLLGLLLLVYTLTPPIQSDGLRYHLAAPQEYIRAGRIVHLPHSAFSNFPFLVEMLFLQGMLVAGDLAAKAMHLVLWAGGALTVAALSTSTSENNEAEFCLSWKNAGLLAGAAFAAVPAYAIVSCWSFIDAGVTAWFLGFVLCLCLCIRRPSRGIIILSGLMGGGALGSKLTMIPMVALGCVLLFLFDWKEAARREHFPSALKRSWKRPVAIGAIALACALPWYLKSLASTGNPFYPMFYGIFGGSGWSEANAALYASKAGLKGFGTTLPMLLKSPWNLTFYWTRFESFNPGPIVLLTLPALLTVFFVRGENRRRALLITAMAAGYYLMWFFGYQSTRFLIPYYGLSAALAGLFMTRSGSRRLHSGWAAALALGACFLIGAGWNTRWILCEANPRPQACFLGITDREQYLSQALDYYPAIRALNADVPAEEAVLCIGEHRGYYFGPRPLISDWFDTPVILDLIRRTKSNGEIFSLLEKENCHHVFFNFGELGKYHHSDFRPRFSPEEYRRFEEFLSSPRLRLRKEIGPVKIFRIVKEESAS